MTQPTIPSKDNHFSYGLGVGDIVCDYTKTDDPRDQPEQYAVYILECEGYDSDGYGTEEKFLEDWSYWASAQDSAVTIHTNRKSGRGRLTILIVCFTSARPIAFIVDY